MKTNSKLSTHALICMTLLLCGATTTFAQTPTLHANGKIAFTSDRDGNREIYVMNADGTDQVRLTNNPGADDCPTWSPDGTRIAFVSQKQDGSFAISMMKADGTNQTEITALDDSNGTGWRRLSWSPDGRRIAFYDFSPVSKSNDIFVVNVDGNDRRNLTPDHANEDLNPVWSPDGSKILFSRLDVYEVYSGTMLHTVNADGTNLTRLENGFADGWNEDTPDWSPAVNKIVYSVNRWDFVNDLYIANPDGTGRQFFHGCDLTDNSCRLDALTPVFSPDGTKVAFSMFNFVGNTPQKLYVKNLDGTGLTLLTDNGTSPSWQPVPLAPPTGGNPIDDAQFFVTEHYGDFLNRQPDSDGLAFWTSNITSCGNDLQCIEVKRINVSASFFLSIEFQQTGYLVYRTYKAAYGNLPGAPVPVHFNEFVPDTKQIGQDVIVNQPGWESALEENKQTFMSEFVLRDRFLSAFPVTMSPNEFVDKLNENAGNPLTRTERDNLVSDLSSGVKLRGDVLRAVAENQNLVNAEFNRAFVLMQYFGYLRRDPNQGPDTDFSGYNFWLNKLDAFNGNFIDAEMVKAFIESAEYRQRFVQ